MAYRDPYAEQPYRQQYNDDFNPYAGTQQAYPTYDQGAAGYDGSYRDDPPPNASPQREPQRQATMRSFLTSNDESTNPERPRNIPPLPIHQRTKSDQTSGFDHGEFTGSPRMKEGFGYKEKTLWTRGGRGRCIGRLCCCTLMITAFLAISILLALALWIRPPSIVITNPDTSSDSRISVIDDGVSIGMGVNISVNNPNYFSVNLKEIKAEIIYPINNTNVGGGTARNVNFPSNAQTNFTFPFAINYTTSIDPQSLILADLVSKCGILGGTKSQLTVDYKITLGIRILMATVSPVVSNSFTFDCPLSADDLGGLGGL